MLDPSVLRFKVVRVPGNPDGPRIQGKTFAVSVGGKIDRLERDASAGPAGPDLKSIDDLAVIAMGNVGRVAVGRQTGVPCGIGPVGDAELVLILS